jgi:hypothetical protein
MCGEREGEVPSSKRIQRVARVARGRQREPKRAKESYSSRRRKAAEPVGAYSLISAGWITMVHPTARRARYNTANAEEFRKQERATNEAQPRM